jgi:hypothetical protein
VCELLGRPTAEDFEEMGVKMADQVYDAISNSRKHTFESFFKKCSPECLDFLKFSDIFMTFPQETAYL